MYVLFLRLDTRFKLEQGHVTTVLGIAVFHIVQARRPCDASPCDAVVAHDVHDRA